VIDCPSIIAEATPIAYCVAPLNGKTAIYAPEETEKAINDALAAIRQRMKALTDAGT
jgi:hypothetical protein